VSNDSLFVMDWAMGSDPGRHIEYLRKYFAAYEPFTKGFYTNDAIDETQKDVNRNYGENYERLVELKNRYDPTNLFRLNANIVPDDMT
jgi:hypothetical protein